LKTKRLTGKKRIALEIVSCLCVQGSKNEKFYHSD